MAMPPTGPKLFELPAELLHMIFQHLDSSDFQRHPKLLRLSKEWYPLARSVLYRDMLFNRATILRIGRGRARFLQTLPELMEQYTVNISIIIYVPDLNDDDFVDVLFSLSWISFQDNPFKQYEDMIAKGMSRLARMLKRSLKLRQITFEMQPEYSLNLFPENERFFVTAWPLSRLPLFLNLSTLYIDTVGSSFHHSHPPKGFPEGYHPCSVIGQVLPRLQSLRCRFREICPDILKPPLDAGDLGLEEVIINLNLRLDLEWDDEESSLCKHFQDANPGTYLHPEMSDAASRLVQRMKNPSMLRLVESGCLGYDCVAQRRLYFDCAFNIGIHGWDEISEHATESDEDDDFGSILIEDEENLDAELWEEEQPLKDGDEVDTSTSEGAGGAHDKD